MTKFIPSELEAKWQEIWNAQNAFSSDADLSQPKYYVLEMFPYPSGRIHMGHVRNYALGDVVARFKRAKGFNVLHPMGWDAFGLPAENAAIERGVHPSNWTTQNIAAMRAQLKTMGLSYDWKREIATCTPDYYKHEQKMFLDFLDAGLAYRKESWVNWDPAENTVLANEQVVDGRGWRSGALVERRKLSQWFLAISEFAEDLLQAIDGLERWPDKVRLMQNNWIGRSEGAELRFARAKRNSAPSERPIQLFCIKRTLSGHRSSPSMACKRSSANSEIAKNHCDNFRRSTRAPDRQPRPSTTCSFARTVFSAGSQFTQLSFR